MKHSKENEALKQQDDTVDGKANPPSSDGAESLPTPGSGRSSPSREWLGDTSATLHPPSSPLNASTDSSKRVCILNEKTKNFYFISNNVLQVRRAVTYAEFSDEEDNDDVSAAKSSGMFVIFFNG
jgi:hypothetical protein